MAPHEDRIVPCPGLDAFVDRYDTLHLVPVDGRAPVRVPAPWGRWVWAVLSGRRIDEASNEEAAAAAALLDELERDRYVLREREVRTLDTEHWDRQVQWFAQEAGHGPERQQRLQDAVVLVLGLGSLGGAVADVLARAGVGTLVLVDDDVVDSTDLARQPLYGVTEVGRHKVDAAATRLAAIAPGVRIRREATEVRSEDDARHLLELHDPQLVVCAADRPRVSIRQWVEGAAAMQGCAVLHGGHRPPHVTAGPMFVPGLTSCSRCVAEARATQESALVDRALDEYLDTAAPVPPAIGWGATTAAGLVATQAVHWLSGAADVVLLGREFQLDLRTLETSWHDLPEVPLCSMCDGTSWLRPARQDR